MIEISVNEEMGTLRATGHAKCGRKGEDIVCAAVSTLVHMLGHEALKKADGQAEDREGTVDIRGYGFRYLAVLKAVTEELREIAEQYPGEVSVTEESDRRERAPWPR